MKNKELLDLRSPAAEERREWQSFLGLLLILDVTPVDPVLYQRCLAAVWRARAGGLISRADLCRHAGFDLGGETLNLELTIARLVRERVIEPGRSDSVLLPDPAAELDKSGVGVCG
jgi:hypothetical protein